MAKKRQQGTERTSAGLRDALFEVLDDLRNGDIEPSGAKAVAGLAREICSTVKLELEVARLREVNPAAADAIVPAPLPLGSLRAA